MRFDKDPGRVSEKWKRNTAPRPNLLINGDFQVAQRGTTFNSGTTPANGDDSYLLDQWNHLTAVAADGANISRGTSDDTTGARYSATFTVTAAGAGNKFGMANFIEAAVAGPLLNKTVSLQFRAKVTGTHITSIRAGIISWSGSADGITSDVVSAWNATGNDPTLAGTWKYENIPTSLSPSTSWQTFKIENVTVTGSAGICNNVAVFIWNDSTTGVAAGETLSIGDVKLEVGNTCTDFVRRMPGEETDLCHRFMFRFQATSAGSLTIFATGVAQDATTALMPIYFPTLMRAQPTMTTDTVGNFSLQDGAATHAVTAMTMYTTASAQWAPLNVVAGGGGLTAGRAAILETTTNNAFIQFSCEL